MTVQMFRIIRAQLVAQLTTIDAALFSLAEPPPELGEQAPCEHPPESRVNLTTMGGPVSWQCRLCGFTQIDP